MRVTTVAELLAVADAPRPAGVAAAAIFDADGTLWRGDIGDTAFSHAGELVLKETWEGPVRAFCDRYGMPLPGSVAELAEVLRSPAHAARARALGMADDAWHEELYALHAWAYAGHSRDTVRAFGARVFASEIRAGIFPGMIALVAALRARGVTVAVVSASPGALVDAAGLAVDATFGMEPAVDDRGLMLPSLARSTYAAGKVTAVRSLLGEQPPLFAFGDSVLGGDRALLGHAHVAVAVNSSGAHRAAALADPRMLLLDPT